VDARGSHSSLRYVSLVTPVRMVRGRAAEQRSSAEVRVPPPFVREKTTGAFDSAGVAIF
jgi:hypothetical protein